MFHSETLAETVYITRCAPAAFAAPKRRMFALITAAVAALALMTASATPVRAGGNGEELAKAIIAAIAIGAIAKSINKGRADPAPQPAPAPAPAPVHDYRPDRVPEVCAIEITGKRRDVTVYPERCMRREGFNYRLPRYCAHEARLYGRIDRVYSEDCLREAGFRVGGGYPRHDDDNGWDRPRHPHGHDRGHGGYGYRD